MDTFAYGRGVPAELRTFPEHLDCTFIDLCEKSAIHNMTLEQKWMETGAEAKLKHVLDIFFFFLDPGEQVIQRQNGFVVGCMYMGGRQLMVVGRRQTSNQTERD